MGRNFRGIYFRYSGEKFASFRGIEFRDQGNFESFAEFNIAVEQYITYIYISFLCKKVNFQ